MTAESEASARVTLILRLLRARIILQWVGGVIMVTAILGAILSNFGLAPINPYLLLTGIAVATLILLGSITCSTVVNVMKKATVTSATDAALASDMANGAPLS